MQNIYTSMDLSAAVAKGPYAWPGGYPYYFITAGGNALSFRAVAQYAESERGKITLDEDDKIIAVDINWEDNDLICEQTGSKIESAYSDD